MSNFRTEEELNKLKEAFENNQENLSLDEKEFIQFILNNNDENEGHKWTLFSTVKSNDVNFITKFLNENENKNFPTPLNMDEIQNLPKGIPLMIVSYGNPNRKDRLFQYNDDSLLWHREIYFSRLFSSNSHGLFTEDPAINSQGKDIRKFYWGNEERVTGLAFEPILTRVFKLNDEFYNKYFINVLRALPGIGEDYLKAKANFALKQEQELWQKLFTELHAKVPVKEGGKRSKKNKKTKKQKSRKLI
uniref:Uncharacterized protein n=1 Tax=viral metagenome TaxID=1070528 RepID=A0A6C0KPI1_9ZZZZ